MKFLTLIAILIFPALLFAQLDSHPSRVQKSYDGNSHLKVNEEAVGFGEMKVSPATRIKSISMNPKIDIPLDFDRLGEKDLKQFVRMGTESSGGGGGFLKSQFLKVARKSALVLAGSHVSWANGHPIPSEKLGALFGVYPNPVQVQIIPTQRPLILHGAQESAVTRGNLIFLYRPDWGRVTDPKEFRSMVLHELMRVVSVPDDDFIASGQLEILIENVESLEHNRAINAISMPPNSREAFLCHDVAIYCGSASQPLNPFYATIELPLSQNLIINCGPQNNFIYVCPSN